METITTGPTISATKYFFKKKINTTLSSSINRSYTQDKETSQVMSYRITGWYSLLNRHNFNISFVLLNRKSKQQMVSNFTEFTGILRNTVSF